jgi:GxxExxY protein
MNTDKHGLKHSEVTQRIIGVFFEVYNELGPGFLESVYVQALAIALMQAGLAVEREKPLLVRFRGEVVGKFRADLVVGDVVLVEAKACPKLNPLHEAQTLNYLRATSLEVGLLVNFGSRAQFRRLLFDNLRKIRPHSVPEAEPW